jgi:molecular chaperone Hsp33
MPDRVTRVESSHDELIRAVSREGSLALRAVVATRLVRAAADRHSTTPTASAALGRALMASVLLAAAGKDGETVQLQFRGDGPLGPVTAISDERGRVRGMVGNPAADLPPRPDGKLDVGAAVGSGMLAVVRYRPGWREPYSGIVPLVSGEVAEDVAHYLAESEQIPAALALGVHVGSDGRVDAAGGFLVQALPHADPLTLSRLEAGLPELPPPTRLVLAGLDAGQILERVAAGLELGEPHRSQPAFWCPCDLERVRRAVTLLGREETRDMARRGEWALVRCEFCGTQYRLHPDDVGSLYRDA